MWMETYMSDSHYFNYKYCTQPIPILTSDHLTKYNAITQIKLINPHITGYIVGLWYTSQGVNWTTLSVLVMCWTTTTASELLGADSTSVWRDTGERDIIPPWDPPSFGAGGEHHLIFILIKPFSAPRCGWAHCRPGREHSNQDVTASP